MTTSRKRFGWRRGLAVFLALMGTWALLDAVMLVVTVVPDRPDDAHFMPPWNDHWWSEFIMAFGLVTIIGGIAVWGARRLWLSGLPKAEEHNTMPPN
jgi:hypothetical protein